MKRAATVPDSRLFDREIRTTSETGAPVVVKYRRVPVRDGYDIEAAIRSEEVPRPLWRQKCCRYEPAFDAEDNITYNGDSDVILHRPNRFCREEAPHDLKACPFVRSIADEN